MTKVKMTHYCRPTTGWDGPSTSSQSDILRFISVGDPSFRLKNGYTQDDAVTLFRLTRANFVFRLFSVFSVLCSQISVLCSQIFVLSATITENWQPRTENLVRQLRT